MKDVVAFRWVAKWFADALWRLPATIELCRKTAFSLDLCKHFSAEFKSYDTVLSNQTHIWLVTINHKSLAKELCTDQPLLITSHLVATKVLILRLQNETIG